jgi:predicted RNA-binding protein associated with RNAse of E/G family
LRPRFTPGSTVIRRDVFRGKLWSAEPRRVLNDDGDGLLLAHWPGVRSRNAGTWIDYLLNGDDRTRKQALADLAAHRWELTDWTWRDTIVLAWYDVDPDFSIHRRFDADGTPIAWYVNFERPLRWTADGFETFDLLVDIVAAPDLGSWRWKDEDEYLQGRELRLIEDDDHYRVREARERAVALLKSRGGPFAGAWPQWRPEPGWPAPSLSG